MHAGSARVRRGLQQLVYVGKITEVNRRRRTKQENVSVEFEDEQFGTTWGHFLASADDYGADRLWVVLEPIPIELDADSEGSSSSPAASQGS